MSKTIFDLSAGKAGMMSYDRSTSYDLSNVVKAACEMSAAMGISPEEALRLFSVVVSTTAGTSESDVLFDGLHFKACDVKVTLVKRGPQAERLPEPGERYIELDFGGGLNE